MHVSTGSHSDTILCSGRSHCRLSFHYQEVDTKVGTARAFCVAGGKEIQ
jgi:hypothetical protein